MNDTAQKIKEKVDIVDFLRGYLTLVPAGKNFKAVCPFHKEKTPSFMVSPDRQTWHCFGTCATGGDIFTFLMRYENVEFFEALKILAERAGIELKRLDPAEERQFGVLYEMNAIAKNFYMDELRKSPLATEYVKKRGLKKETLNEFEVGFAPNIQDALTLHLIRKGFSVTDIERSGLSIKGDRGGYFDRFRGRIMFPILNHFGKTVGFTGRIMPEFDSGNMGKYVNSPETAIFKKSKVLYGFHKTKQAIRDASEALLVEGQMDFLMCWQDGIKTAIATSGTALTPDHLTVLRKYAERAILSFDADEAGLEAAERAIDLCAQFDFDVRILAMPSPYKDPGEVVEKRPGLLAELMGKAKPAMDFYFDKYLGSGADKKMNKKSVKAVLGKIKKLSSTFERGKWIKELSERSEFSLSEKDLTQEMDEIKVEEPKQAEAAAPLHGLPPEKVLIRKPASRHEMLAENLVSLAAAKGDFTAIPPHLNYFPPLYRQIVAVLNDPEVKADPELKEFASALSLRSGLDMTHDEGVLLADLKREYAREKSKELLREIKLAEFKGDDQVLREKLKELDQLSRELHN